jgi:hydroxymethylpyrimidine/phosphomethylpyrimidine kinase
MTPAVLLVGGLDPAGRAGLLADVRAVEAMGARALCVVTATTLQTSRRAEGFEPVPARVVARQIAMLLEDDPIAAIKLGQLASEETARAIAPLLSGLVVVDTPLATSSGTGLFSARSVRAAYAPIIERATLLTPNRVEITAWVHDPETAASTLGVPVLLKGGHAPGDVVTDVLLRPDGSRRSFESHRIPGKFRGTGCRLASAVAARLALDDDLETAIETARAWLVGRLQVESVSGAS